MEDLGLIFPYTGFPRYSRGLRSLKIAGYSHILRAAFSYKCVGETYLYLGIRFKLFWRKNIDAKAAHIMLVKLTTVVHSITLHYNKEFVIVQH